MERMERPLSHLKVALQCGGSDAFSGVSGNPLAAYVAKEVIRYGAAVNLAETDELIGAEPYMLQNAKDFETASRFLEVIERFKERAPLARSHCRIQSYRWESLSRTIQHCHQIDWGCNEA